MNEEGNITFSILAVLIVVAVTTVLTWTVIASSGVASKSKETMLSMYKKDTPLEVAKYVITNEILNQTFTSFDDTTTLITPQQLTGIENEINLVLNHLDSEYSITLSNENNVFIEDLCDTFVSTEGTSSMYCEYTPFNIIFKVTTNKQTTTGGVFTLSLTDLHFVEAEGLLTIDSTTLQLNTQ